MSTSVSIEPIQQPTDLANMSQIVLRIRPWDHEQEMSQLIVTLFGININGVTWGANTTENIGYGIRELVVTAVLDESILSIDDLVEELIALDDIISRVDVSLWNKVQ